MKNQNLKLKIWITEITVLFKTLFFIFSFTFCASHASGLVSCNPATDKEEVIFVPRKKEVQMGRNIDEQVRKRFDIPVDPLIQERIEKIGEKLAAGTDRKDIVYYFRVLAHKKDDYYNAFAAPGGYIYIFEDLVEAMKEDNKIAAVLAHEMGHVEAKHSVKRLQGSFGAAALMLLGAQMSAGGGESAKINDAVNQLMASYSRHDERQADELSVKYLERAGYDAASTIGALEELKRLRKKGARRKYMLYQSHPYVSERIAHLNKLIKGYTDFDSYINFTQDKRGF